MCFIQIFSRGATRVQYIWAPPINDRSSQSSSSTGSSILTDSNERNMRYLTSLQKSQVVNLIDHILTHYSSDALFKTSRKYSTRLLSSCVVRSRL